MKPAREAWTDRREHGRRDGNGASALDVEEHLAAGEHRVGDEFLPHHASPHDGGGGTETPGHETPTGETFSSVHL
jgi:hypothetical protein